MPTKNEILAVRALRNRKTRSDECKFVVEGLKGVEEALASGWLVHGLYATADSKAPEDWEAERVSSKDMSRMSTLKAPPGILAVMGIPEVPADKPGPLPPASFSLAIDGLSDPGNLGTIIRTADWFGISGIWVSRDTVDPFNPKVVQATMGAIFRMPIWTVDLAETLGGFSSEGAIVQGLDLEGESLWEMGGPPASAARIAVLGSESHGLSEDVKAACSGFIHIPGGGQSESLNASMAAGIAMAAWHGQSIKTT